MTADASCISDYGRWQARHILPRRPGVVGKGDVDLLDCDCALNHNSNFSIKKLVFYHVRGFCLDGLNVVCCATQPQTCFAFLMSYFSNTKHDSARTADKRMAMRLCAHPFDLFLPIRRFLSASAITGVTVADILSHGPRMSLPLI